VSRAVAGGLPYVATHFPDRDEFVRWLQDFPDRAMRSKSPEKHHEGVSLAEDRDRIREAAASARGDDLVAGLGDRECAGERGDAVAGIGRGNDPCGDGDGRRAKRHATRHPQHSLCHAPDSGKETGHSSRGITSASAPLSSLRARPSSVRPCA
jgi:hypothetical protein